MLEFNSQFNFLAKQYVKLFIGNPALTTFATFILISSLSLGIFFLDRADKKNKEAERLKNLNYQTQIEQLDDMENNVKQLLEFVGTQKKALKENEDTISFLKSEREKIEPLLETDQAIIEAFFMAHEERANAKVWRDRWIGFGFGVVASLIASFIWLVIRLLCQKWGKKTTTS